MISSDKPKIKLEDDQFERTKYAENLAKIIIDQSNQEGFVIGVYGTWGSGKSTFLEYILRYLESSTKSSNNSLITVVRFNPWWFSGKQDLTIALLRELQSKLKNTHEPTFKQAKQLIKSIAILIGTIELFSDLQTGNWIPRIFAYLLSSFRSKNKKALSIPEIKQDISDELKKIGRKILIVVDDIDRLFPNEILQLFSVIKGLVDLPNVIYLLAMDRKCVTEIIKGQTKLDGDAFLEKIVQIPVELPKPTQIQLDAILFPAIEKIRAGNSYSSNTSYSPHNWDAIYQTGIRKLINTPRDVLRFVNALTANCPMIKNKVAFGNFFAMEAIRLFEPSLYDFIYENKDTFTQHSKSWLAILDKKGAMEKLKASLEKDWPSLKATIQTLFPQTKTNEPLTFDDNNLGRWKKECWVRHCDILNYYFSLSKPTGSITNNEVEILLRSASSAEAFEKNLLNASLEPSANYYSKAIALIEQLPAYINDINESAIRNIVNALCNMGDKLLCPRNYEYHLSIADLVHIIKLGHELIKRLPNNKVYSLLKQSIASREALLIQAYLLEEIEEDINNSGYRFDAKDLQSNQAKISELKSNWCKKLLKLPKASDLLEHPKFADILMFLDKWGNKIEVGKWSAEITKLDINLQKFLERNLRYSYVSQGDVLEIVPKLSIEYLERYIDLANCKKRLLRLQKSRKILKSSPKYKIAISLFLEGTDEFLSTQNTKNP